MRTYSVRVCWVAITSNSKKNHREWSMKGVCFYLCHISTDLMQITFEDGIFISDFETKKKYTTHDNSIAKQTRERTRKPREKKTTIKKWHTKWEISFPDLLTQNYTWTQSIFNFSFFFCRSCVGWFVVLTFSFHLILHLFVSGILGAWNMRKEYKRT